MVKKKIIPFLIEMLGVCAVFFLAYFSGEQLGLSIHDMETGSTVKQLDNYGDYELPTKVYDINGELITEFYSVNRKLTHFPEVPINLIRAFLITEDKHFYAHNGFDIPSVMRAMIENIKAFGIVEGGSTISQQLTKLLYTDREKTFTRKIKELKYTLILEKRYSKSEILEKYLNKIYFGHNVYGVASAADFFFNKSVEDLSAAECALLASMPSAPNRNSPFQNKEQAKLRQRNVLNRMIAAGYTSQEEVDKNFPVFWNTMHQNIIVKSNKLSWASRKDKAPYFSEYVRQIAENCLIEELGYDKNYLYTGGLTIYTTLNLKKQVIARQILQDQLAKQTILYQRNTRRLYEQLNHYYTDLYNFIGFSNLNPNYNFRHKQGLAEFYKSLEQEADVLELLNASFSLDRVGQTVEKYQKLLTDDNRSLRVEGALISLEPKTGHIVAMIGGSKFSRRNQFNRVVSARRQPGSTFKAFVYGAALETGRFHPGTVVGYRKDAALSVSGAIKNSVNSVAQDVIRYIGPKRVIDFAAPMLGIDGSRLPEDPSLALGTGEVTPLELCRGIAVYANDGYKVEPVAIRKIIDRRGRVLKDFDREIYLKGKVQLVDPNIARAMTSMLRGVIAGGTGRRAYCGRPAAGKTGSTQTYKDAWFVGYTPNLATAVWVGFDKGQSLGYHQYGGEVAAPVWGRFMREAHKDLPYINFKLRYSLGGIKAAPWVKVPVIESEANRRQNKIVDGFIKDLVQETIEPKGDEQAKLRSDKKNIKTPESTKKSDNKLPQKTEKPADKKIVMEAKPKKTEPIKRPEKVSKPKVNKEIESFIDRQTSIFVPTPQKLVIPASKQKKE